MERRRRWGIWRLAAGVLVVASSVVLIRSGVGRSNAGTQAAAPAALPVPIVATPASTRDVGVYLVGLGAVTPRATVTVRTQVNGQLMSLRFQEGQLVNAGDLLAEIDPRPFQAQLTQFEGQLTRDRALLDNARIDLHRFQVLWSQDSIAKQQLDSQESLVRQFEGAVRNDQGLIDGVKVQLIYCRITSPNTISNQTIRLAEAQFQQARALVRQARAAYFPTVSIGIGVSRSRGTALSTGLAPQGGGVSGGGGSGGGATTDYSLPINAAWELDVWGRIRRSVESNQASAQASAADLAAARLSLQTEQAQDYFLLRTLDEQTHLLEETVADFQRSLEITKNQYNSGVVSQADVLQAETQLETTRAQLIDVGVQRAQTEHAIALLVGTAASAFSLPAAPLIGLPASIPAGVPSELLERRPDVAAAERLVASANAQIGFAEAAYYPTITLSASGGFNSTSLAKWLVWPSRFWSIGPTISETVFDGGLRRAQTDFARAGYAASVASYREAVLAAFQQVEDNLAALRILAEEGTVQDAAVQAARQTVTVTLNEYKAGTVSYLNVIVAQTAELTNEINALLILDRRMSATVLLIQALGGGWSTTDLPSVPDVTARP